MHCWLFNFDIFKSVEHLNTVYSIDNCRLQRVTRNMMHEHYAKTPLFSSCLVPCPRVTAPRLRLRTRYHLRPLISSGDTLLDSRYLSNNYLTLRFTYVGRQPWLRLIDGADTGRHRYRLSTISRLVSHWQLRCSTLGARRGRHRIRTVHWRYMCLFYQYRTPSRLLFKLFVLFHVICNCMAKQVTERLIK